MKRIFTCCKCGIDFEIEADHFIPGVSGTVVTSEGVKHEYVDPTGDHKCMACIYIELLESAEQLGLIKDGKYVQGCNQIV